jgi:surface-adhesin protein E
MAMSTAPAAQSTSWHFVVKSEDGQVSFYADTKSLASHGKTRTLRVLYDYQQTQQDPDTLVRNLSTIELLTVDCENRRMAPVQSSSYAGHRGEGALVGKSLMVPMEQLRYVAVAADSLDEKVLRYACAKAAVHDSI